MSYGALAHTWRSLQSAYPIKQSLPSHLAVGQIFAGVLSAPTSSGSGWLVRLDCPGADVDALVPRPYGSNGPMQGDEVLMRLVAVDHVTGSVVATLIQGKSGSSIK